VNTRSDRAASWIYVGIWARLVAWFRVPHGPPSLPAQQPDTLRQVHPAPGFLRYLKFRFWLLLTIFDGMIVIAWIAITVASPLAGALLLIPALVIAVAPDVVVYIALHLRYDTTWYVMSSRSLRIRRGVWVLREMTITFENVQNIKVTQGPLMRYFGIKNVVVETAGSAGSGRDGGEPAENQAVLEGLDDANEIRDLILARVRASRSAGLGDERPEVARGVSRREDPNWTAAQVRLLREIRDEAALLAR
jgi:membrane protein YdbS with pleckstrin-like domain